MIQNGVKLNLKQILCTCEHRIYHAYTLTKTDGTLYDIVNLLLLQKLIKNKH